MRTSAITVRFRKNLKIRNREKNVLIRIKIVAKSNIIKKTSILLVTNSIKVVETTGNGIKSGRLICSVV